LLKASEKIPQPAYAYHRQYDSLTASAPLSSRLGNIKVPTLVVHGEEDRVVPLPNAHHLAKNIPNADLVVIPDCGHMFFIEKLEHFVESVVHFLHQKVWKIPSPVSNAMTAMSKSQEEQSHQGFSGG
jgi:pimeloyl-ACP methyl ester carboxylesterase